MPDLSTVPPVIAAWIKQLLNDEVQTLAQRDGQVEIRLYANRGQTRKHPMICLNAGPSQMEAT